MKKTVGMIIGALFLIISSNTIFASENQGINSPIQSPAPSSVGQTIAQNFPDPNLAQVVADELTNGDVNIVLNQTMVDSFVQLNAGSRDISDITGIEILTNLEYLDLGYNQITTLPDNIGNLSNLNHLDLSSNQLTTLPESIGNLSNLNHLMLANNKLTKLPDNLGNLSALSSLFVFENQLTALPESIGNLSNLIELNVSSNQLTSFPNSISQLSNLLAMDNWSNLLPTDFADTLNTFGWNIAVYPDPQLKLQLKLGLSPYIIQHESDINVINLPEILELTDGGTPVTLSPAHDFILENFTDENNDPVSLEAYLKNGIVQKPGKVFAQIRATGTGLFPNTSDNAITADKIELQFEITEYELAFNLNGGTGTTPAKQMLIEGATGVAVETPTRVGHTFKSWNTSMDGSGDNWIPGITPMLANNLILYAQWEKDVDPIVNYTLQFDLNGGQGVTPANQILNEGQRAMQPEAPLRAGYEFKEWNTSKDGTGESWNFETNTMPANDVTLYAQWTKKTLPKTGESSQTILFSTLLMLTGTSLIYTIRKKVLK